MVSFDLAQVQALQEDVNAKWERLTAALDAAGITVNSFLSLLGMQTEPGGDVPLIPSSKIIVKMDGPEVEIVGQSEAAPLTQIAQPEPETEPDEDELTEDEPIKRLKMMEESLAHNGVWYSELQCPICYSYGATVYPDHKGLAICGSCTITFDPAIEGVTNANGRG